MSDDAPDFDLAAAGLRADGGDALAHVEVLATKLEDALPGRARVDRRAVRLFSRDKRVARIEVDLGEATYQLESDGRNVAGTRGQAVRGVTIKREELGLDACAAPGVRGVRLHRSLGLDAWVTRLTEDLHGLAGSSGEARDALERLLGA